MSDSNDPTNDPTDNPAKHPDSDSVHEEGAPGKGGARADGDSDAAAAGGAPPWLKQAVLGVVVALVALLVGAALWGSSGISESANSPGNDEPEKGFNSDAPLASVEEFGGLSREHVESDVEVKYPAFADKHNPPVGGEHQDKWVECGITRLTPEDEEAVHSLEHGAVWLTFSVGTPSTYGNAALQKAQKEEYVLASPYKGQEAPLVMTAWGVQLSIPRGASLADTRRAMDEFVQQYANGPQTPEPGAPC